MYKFARFNSFLYFFYFYRPPDFDHVGYQVDVSYMW